MFSLRSKMKYCRNCSMIWAMIHFVQWLGCWECAIMGASPESGCISERHQAHKAHWKSPVKIRLSRVGSRVTTPLRNLKILAVVISLLGNGFCLGVGFLLWIWKDPLSNSVDFHKVQRRYDLFHLADNAFAAENKREKENASFLLSAFATVFWHCLCKMLLLF